MRTSSFRRLGLIRPLALACGLAFAGGAAQAAPDAKLLAAAQKAQPAVTSTSRRWFHRIGHADRRPAEMPHR
jgi:hypothetical protein